METQQIHEAAARAHVSAEALDQVTLKVQTHFGQSSLSPAALDAYLRGLPVWERLGMTEAAFLAKPDTWRLAQGHTFQLLPGRVQRLPPMNLTAEELATLPPSGPERLTAARELHAKKHAQG